VRRHHIVLGITGVGDRFHDNSVCLVVDGKVVFAASEERYTRVKHDASFPESAIKAALKFGEIKFKDVDIIATGWPRTSLVKVLLNENKIDLFLSGIHFVQNANLRAILDLVRLVGQGGLKPVSNELQKSKIVEVDHYLAHASSAYRTSGFEKCICVVWDGFGAKSDGLLASGGVFECIDGEINEVNVHPLNVSIGLFYEAVTNALGFTPAEGEGKTMGLACYGNYKRFLKRMEIFAPRFQEDRWVKSKHWPDTLVGVDLAYKPIFDSTYMGRELKRMAVESAKDTAAACQYIIERESVAYFKYLYQKYGHQNYALAGGVFLNVKVGKKIMELPFVKGYFVHPHAGDGGLAIGAALEVYTKHFPNGSLVCKMESSALGDEFLEPAIHKELKRYKKLIYFKPQNIAKYVASEIAQGKVVGWFQGRAEWGPRALGQRSVLADPRKIEIKERINNYLKKREWFMPFAASILDEYKTKLFENAVSTPFMTMAFDATPFGKKAIKAAIHIDNTGRPQTVRKETNPLYWKVIHEFYELTGVPAILNTSFNRHGLPIVNSPRDAIDHLLWGAIDELAIGSYVAKIK